MDKDELTVRVIKSKMEVNAIFFVYLWLFWNQLIIVWDASLWNWGNIWDRIIGFGLRIKPCTVYHYNYDLALFYYLVSMIKTKNASSAFPIKEIL